MFSKKKKKEQLPSFIEGTQGRYVRRASPPPVPSLTTHSIPKKGPPTSILTTSESASSATITTQIQSQTINNPSSAKNSVSHTSVSTAADSSGAGEQSRRQSTASYISGEIPYNAVSYQPSTSANRHLLVHQQHFDYDNGKRSPQPGALSSHSFCDPRREHHRKPLTTSHSIGNVESIHDPYEQDYGYMPEIPQQKFVSLQSLPGRNLADSIVGDTCIMSGTPAEDELPLPPNWAIEVTQEGIRYYVDHNTRRTHWIHPLAHENLPPGWRKIFSEQTGVLYYNEVDGRSQIEHPGLAPPINRTESMLVASGRAESATIEHLNIIHQEEVPEWLMMYSQADSDLDHLLEWDLFNTLQLEQFEQMMRKLYKQEVIDTVRRYERMRTVLNREICRRTQPRPQPPDILPE